MVYLLQAKSLNNNFHLKLSDKTVEIKWRDKIQDTEVLKKTGMHLV